jgi:hypothetical protein
LLLVSGFASSDSPLLAQCPSRQPSTLEIEGVIDVPVTVERRVGGGSYLVIFQLRPQHAFVPTNPCSTADGVVTTGSQVNVGSTVALVADSSRVIIELTPTVAAQAVKYCFRVNFEENFNNTSVLTPRRKKRALFLPPLNDLELGQIIHLIPGLCTTSCNTDPD